MIGAVLGWKFNDYPGICTRNNVITAWPTALGPQPTQAQIDTWTAEYLTAVVNRRQRQLTDLVNDIQALTAADRNKLIAAVCAAYLREHPKFARQLNIALDGDEPS